MNQSLHTTVTGQGPDLLLIHGWGMHSAVWGEFANLLAQNFRVTLVDLPGHGLSPMLAGRDLASWTTAVLAVAPPHAHWLGWSLGAQIALSAAVQQPDRVSRLCLISGNPCFVRQPDWPTAMDAAQFSEFYRLVERDGAAALTRFMALQVHGMAKPRQDLQQIQALLKQRPTATYAALLAGLNILRDSDLREACASAPCPILALFGANDALVPTSVAPAMQQLRSSPDDFGLNQNHFTQPTNLLVETLPNTTHQAFLTHPQDCAHLVTEFLRVDNRA